MGIEVVMYITANYADSLFIESNMEDMDMKLFMDKINDAELKQNDHGQYFILKDIGQLAPLEQIPQ